LQLFSDDYVSSQIDIDDLDPETLAEQPASRMLVLERFDLPQDYGAVLDGWVFTCKSEIMNLQALLQCSAVNGLYVSCDGSLTTIGCCLFSSARQLLIHMVVSVIRGLTDFLCELV
jgi:hypothetical protein